MSDFDLALDLLLKVVPIIVAFVALIYAVLQRGVVKREISKKKYLELSLTNLNEQIATLQRIKPHELAVNNPSLGDFIYDAKTVVFGLLALSFDLKKRRLILDVSYNVR